MDNRNDARRVRLITIIEQVMETERLGKTGRLDKAKAEADDLETMEKRNDSL